ncbi:MAG: hypothetical protein ACXAB2_15705 [Candidatus Hodarchaeales archaeon]|jgi:hypothetical protein
MSIDNIMKKSALFAVITGGMLALSILFITINLNNPGPGGTPGVEDGVGFQIAARMEASEENVSYVWIYNNTFANVNLSSHYDEYIDGVGIGIVEEVLKMALVHEPTADIADINQNNLNTVMAKFRTAIKDVENVSEEFTGIDQLLPPSFICDIAYEDGTSLSLVFSKEHKVLGVINGTWTTSTHSHHGLPLISLSHYFDDAAYLEFPDSSKMITAIQSFEDFILQTFPVD